MRSRLGAAVLAALSIGAGVARAAPSACAQRRYDGGRVVGISGERLSALAGRSESELRAWAWREGKRRAVPFQVDACDASGGVILGNREAPAPPARLGPRTVALFRAQDAGERAPAGAAVGSPVAEIAVQGAPEARRWLYLGPGDPSLPPSAEDEVDYDPERDRVQASRYTLGFQGSEVTYFSLADGKGRERGNLVDRLKARVEARILWGLVRFRRDEEDVRQTVLGWRDGPIRVVRRARLDVEVGWGIPPPEIVADDTFYADRAEGPISIAIPFPLAYVFGDLDVRIYLDFRDLRGFRLEAEGLNGESVLVGEPREILEGASPTRWFRLSRDGLALEHRVRFGPGLSSVCSGLYFVYDPARPDPPEAVPGLSPGVGYRLTQWSRVPRGRHEIWLEVAVRGDDPTAASEGDARPGREPAP